MQARTVLAPQVGFNNNVKHKGLVFHIQTEDSGINHPHITTHLFADGGRILRSERTDYSELLGDDELAALLRRRMKEQHRAMFVALREGHLDHLIDELSSPHVSHRPAVSVSGGLNGSEVPVTPSSAGRPRLSSEPGIKRPSPRPSIERVSTTRVSDRAIPKSAANDSSGGHRAVRPTVSGGSSTSIFGTGDLSEQSLDDVILSYISDDLDGD